MGTQVARDLSDTVFDEVFPALAEALAQARPRPPRRIVHRHLAEVRQGALILLYRLLFVLYAEDRNLLPDENGPYADYCLTKIRNEVADEERRARLSERACDTYWSRLDGVFQAIANGDDELGIPPYNGGLFDPAAAPILSRVQLPMPSWPRSIFGLSRT